MERSRLVAGGDTAADLVVEEQNREKDNRHQRRETREPRQAIFSARSTLKTKRGSSVAASP